jgi:hypothetical protein
MMAVESATVSVDNLEGVQKVVQMLVVDLPMLHVDLSATVEHAYGPYDQHVPWLALNNDSGAAVLIMFHPDGCGCNALTHELVWHG